MAHVCVNYNRRKSFSLHWVCTIKLSLPEKMSLASFISLRKSIFFSEARVRVPSYIMRLSIFDNNNFTHSLHLHMPRGLHGKIDWGDQPWLLLLGAYCPRRYYTGRAIIFRNTWHYCWRDMFYAFNAFPACVCACKRTTHRPKVGLHSANRAPGKSCQISRLRVPRKANLHIYV